MVSTTGATLRTKPAKSCPRLQRQHRTKCQPSAARCNSSQHQHGKACSTGQAAPRPATNTHTVQKSRQHFLGYSAWAVCAYMQTSNNALRAVTVHYCLLCNTCSWLPFISSARQHVLHIIHLETKKSHTSTPYQQLTSTPPHKIKHLPQLEPMQAHQCAPMQSALYAETMCIQMHMGAECCTTPLASRQAEATSKVHVCAVCTTASPCTKTWCHSQPT